MRITAQAKQRTRQAIVDQAARLFAERGFEATTTRDLASAAGIAAGTLFNYFPSKEVLAATILADAAAEGAEAFLSERTRGADLEEELFAHAAAGLRHLEPHRGWALEVLEALASPLRGAAALRSATGDETPDLRADHLEHVALLLREHGLAEQASAVTLHLYWTLYLGVLGFWARDDSPHRQETLALLDRSMRLLVYSLREHGAA